MGYFDLLNIHPEDRWESGYFWLLDFAEQRYRREDRYERGVAELANAIACSEWWSICFNETVLQFDPTTGFVTAVPTFSEYGNEGSMEAVVYLSILKEMRAAVVSPHGFRS